MLNPNHLVTKSNAINEMRYRDMSVQEMRLFTVYLSRINHTDISTRRVKFSLDEFKKLMNLNPKTSISYMKQITASMLKHVITEPIGDKGEYKQYQIFKNCEVTSDHLGKWYVTIDAHDDALPLMFEYKNKYFSYKLWNTLRLNSTNKIRMYELLKQYARTEQRTLTITLADLKEKLDIDPEEYARWDNFKNRVIDPCQKDLKAHTDICFTYKTIKKSKAVTAIKFTVEDNDAYDHQVSLDEYVDETQIIKQRSDFDKETDYFRYVESLPQDIQDSIIAEELRLNHIELLKEVVDFSFTENEMALIFDELCRIIPYSIDDDPEFEQAVIVSDERKEVLRLAYQKLKRYETVEKVENRFGYLLKTLNNTPNQ